MVIALGYKVYVVRVGEFKVRVRITTSVTERSVHNT